MAKPREPRALTSHCSIKDAELKLEFPAAEILKDLKARIENRLGKRGYAVTWTEAGQNPELQIRLVRIDQGNQLLRYLLPFAAPAVVALEGQIAGPDGETRTFVRVRKAHFGLFGGKAQTMLKACNAQLAKDIAREVAQARG